MAQGFRLRLAKGAFIFCDESTLERPEVEQWKHDLTRQKKFTSSRFYVRVSAMFVIRIKLRNHATDRKARRAKMSLQKDGVSSLVQM